MSEDIKLCLKILDEAMAFEDEGMRIFQEREKVASAPLERRIFASLARDEAGHKAYLAKMRDGLAATNDLSVMKCEEGEVRQTARQIFANALEGGDETGAYQADELEILQGALEVEKRGYHMYKAAAQEVESTQAKAVFEELAAQEQFHYQLLHNTLEYLNDPAAFNAYDESPMLDGG